MLNRTEIIAAAAKLFRRKGYSATTMQDIADRLKVTKAAIYYYVKSKEEILCECFDQAISVHEEYMSKVMAEDSSAEEKIRAVISDLCRVVVEARPITSVMLSEKAHLPRARQSEVTRRMNDYLNIVAGLLRQAADEGIVEVRDPKVTALAIVGMCNSIDPWFKPNGPIKARDLGAMLADIVLSGLLTEKGRARREDNGHVTGKEVGAGVNAVA